MRIIALIVLCIFNVTLQAQRVSPPNETLFLAIIESAGVEKHSLLDEGIIFNNRAATRLLKSEAHQEGFPKQLEMLSDNSVWYNLLMSLSEDTTRFKHKRSLADKTGIKFLEKEKLEQWYNADGKLNWGVFRQQCSTPHGFYQISKISISKDKSKAVAIFSIFYDEETFASMLLMLENKETWQVTNIVKIW